MKTLWRNILAHCTKYKTFNLLFLMIKIESVRNININYSNTIRSRMPYLYINYAEWCAIIKTNAIISNETAM